MRAPTRTNTHELDTRMNFTTYGTVLSTCGSVRIPPGPHTACTPESSVEHCQHQDCKYLQYSIRTRIKSLRQIVVDKYIGMVVPKYRQVAYYYKSTVLGYLQHREKHTFYFTQSKKIVLIRTTYAVLDASHINEFYIEHFGYL